MSLQRIILIGGGGHCKACIDVIQTTNKYVIKGILDTKGKIGSNLLGMPVIGTDEDIPALVGQTDYFLVTVGQIKSADARKKIYETVKANGGKFTTIISSRAYVSSYAHIEEGTIVMHDALVNASAKIGANCIVNNKALIEHDVVIGDNCHISTHAVINGDSTVGNEVFIGSNATISSQVAIGDNIIIGAGAVVYKNIKEPGTYAGNPAKKLS